MVNGHVERSCEKAEYNHDHSKHNDNVSYKTSHNTLHNRIFHKRIHQAFLYQKRTNDRLRDQHNMTD